MPLPPTEEFYRIQKLPPYVFAVINDLRDQMRASGVDVIDMGMGNPDGASPDRVVQKLIETAPDPRNHRYSVSRGIADLRKAIVNRYRKQYDVALDPETECIVTMGAKDALAHLLYAILAPGDATIAAAAIVASPGARIAYSRCARASFAPIVTMHSVSGSSATSYCFR